MFFEQVEFELTNKCNAACPQCPRANEDAAEILRDTDQEITLADIKQWFDKESLQHVRRVTFKGTFSEPVIAREFYEIVEFFVNNTQAIVKIHTNGGLRKKDWWSKLGNLLKQRGTCIFGIDGIGDTHSIYRVNTNYDKVIENASAFINAGGIGVWQFLVFKHNEHQIAQAKQESIRLNFNEFFTLGSDRFSKDDSIVNNKKDMPIEKSQVIPSNTREDYKNIQINTKHVSCQSQKTKWILIDWTGEAFPCCFSQIWKKGIVRKDFGSSYWYNKIVKDPNNTNLHHTKLKDVSSLFEEFYDHLNQKIIPQVCSHYCSSKN